jgi:hypothetical protein
MSIRMGYWDCPGCGQKRIEGPERSCKSCGRPRDADVKFYTDDDAPEIEAPEQVARAKAGADWQCPYCGTDNVKGSAACAGCGATNAGAKSRVEQVMLDHPQPPPPRSSSKKTLLIVLAAIALAVFGVYRVFLRTKPLEVTVTRSVWVKAIDVERLRAETHEAWQDDVPASARVIHRANAPRTRHVQVGTQHVKVGKKDLGNGYFEDVYEDRPRYEDRQLEDVRVTYEIERWTLDRKLKNESTDGREPDYPQLAPSLSERIGHKQNEIDLDLGSDDRKTHHYSVDLLTHPDLARRASDYAPGKTFIARVNAVGSVLSLEPR